MNDPAQPLVTIKNLTFSRGNRVIFDQINLTIPQGKITAIMGPSGTGKTTLLRLIGGQLKPDSGTITVLGEDIHYLSRGNLYRLRRQMGLLFQTNALFTNLSVFDNVAFPYREHTHLSSGMIRDLVLMKLEAVGLRGTIHLYPRELSGGMARRVALARTIALDPSLMMYDEPFTGQDPISMGVLVKLVRDLNHALHMTSIIVSHDVPETASIADYMYLLSGASIVAEGTPKTLARDESPYVKQFMHGLPDGIVPFHYPAPDFSEMIFRGVDHA